MWFYKRAPVTFWIYAVLLGVGAIIALSVGSRFGYLDTVFFALIATSLLLAHLPVRLSPLIAFQGAYIHLFFLVYCYGHPVTWIFAILLDMYMMWRDAARPDLRYVFYSGARMAAICAYLIYARQFFVESGLVTDIVGHFIVVIGLAVFISVLNWVGLLAFGTYRLRRYIVSTGITYDLARYLFLGLFALLLVVMWDLSLESNNYLPFWVTAAMTVAIQMLMYAWQSSEEVTRHIKRMLVGLIDWRDRYADSRSLENRELCVNFARFLKWQPKLIETVNSASLLHDVGKVIVSDSVLHKQERLTVAEFDIVKKHVEFAAVEIETIPGFKNVANAVRDHHERWDGKGYPAGKKGEEISEIGRLLSLSDSFMAMVKSRPFRPGMSREKVLDVIEAELNTQFAPEMGKEFLKFMKEGAEPLDYLIFYPARPR
jgi:HD-GYP domain-containing protein (c-di-GMP phosphodiesterase class II)